MSEVKGTLDSEAETQLAELATNPSSADGVQACPIPT